MVIRSCLEINIRRQHLVCLEKLLTTDLSDMKGVPKTGFGFLYIVGKRLSTENSGLNCVDLISITSIKALPTVLVQFNQDRSDFIDVVLTSLTQIESKLERILKQVAGLR